MPAIQTPAIQTIMAAANPLLKDVRRAVARGGLTDDGYWVAEGFHLLDEALRSGLRVPVILVAESKVEKVSPSGRSRVVVVSDPVFRTIAATETTQGVIALVDPPQGAVDDVFGERSLVVVLDGVQDPGNAGAVVRAAEAFGATGVLFAKGAVSPHHPKTVRGSAGSLFRVPFLAGIEPGQAGALLREREVHVFAAMPFTGEGRRAGDTDFRQPSAIVIGSEGRGVSAELLRFAEPVTIPTVGVESLNAAVAAAILLYEAHRQRT